MKDMRSRPEVWAFGALAIAFGLNFAAVKFGFEPFVYCWFGDLVWSVYGPWQAFIGVIALFVMVIWGVVKGIKGLFLGGVIVLIVYAIPVVVHGLFSLGQTC